MTPNEMRDILARELFVLCGDYYRDEWWTEPERRREYYREQANLLIGALAASRIAVIPPVR